MSDHTHEPLPQQAARLFREMADAVDLNSSAFSGAFVVVGPDGQVKKMLLVNDQPEPAMFWSNAEMMCKMAVAELEAGSPLNPRQQNWR
jgi:hypothetical protein